MLINAKTVFIVILLLLFNVRVTSAWSLFKECIDIDNTFYYQIIDEDTIDIGNDKYWSITSVNCEGIKWNAFSRCENCPVLPNSSVKLPDNINKICSGDTIYVQKTPCIIGKIKKEGWGKK